MNSKILFIAGIFAMVLMSFSCKSNDKKDKRTDTLATEYCDCIKLIEPGLSDDTKRIINNAAKSDDPGKSIKEDIMAMGIEKGLDIQEEIESVENNMDPGTETGRCVAKLEEKYKDVFTSEVEKGYTNLINELDGKTGCDFTVSLLKIALKMKDSHEADSE